MRPVHHREPGPIVALLDAPSVVCEQIADGVHLHDGMLRHAIHTAGPDRVALITDAIDAAGMPDGELRARRSVGPRGARGGPAGTGRCHRRQHAHHGRPACSRTVQSGVSIVDASRMASGTPARALGLHARARRDCAVGRRADLVLLDDELTVTGVLRGGAPYPA